jgi:hypothetical protein
MRFNVGVAILSNGQRIAEQEKTKKFSAVDSGSERFAVDE